MTKVVCCNTYNMGSPAKSLSTILKDEQKQRGKSVWTSIHAKVRNKTNRSCSIYMGSNACQAKSVGNIMMARQNCWSKVGEGGRDLAQAKTKQVF